AFLKPAQSLGSPTKHPRTAFSRSAGRNPGVRGAASPLERGRLPQTPGGGRKGLGPAAERRRHAQRSPPRPTSPPCPSLFTLRDSPCAIRDSRFVFRELS